MRRNRRATQDSGRVTGRSQIRKSTTKNDQHGTTSDKSLKQGALNVVILFHLFAIVCWAVPVSTQPLPAIRDLVRPYMIWTSLDQSWDMFAPNPRDRNTYIKAAVFTQRHHMKVWIFPRMEELSLYHRFREDRYRTFEELIALQKNAPILPYIALHIARSFNSPGDPPDKVMLIEFGGDIDPAQSQDSDSVTKTKIIYEDYVDAGDLQ
jgi:hypothetical protein